MGYTKEQQREYDRLWYQNNKERRVAINKKYSERNSAYITELKLKTGCKDCGYNAHSEALEYDHLDGATKSFNISYAVMRAYSLERLLKEIAKCELVCANCHRVRTYNRKVAALAQR